MIKCGLGKSVHTDYTTEKDRRLKKQADRDEGKYRQTLKYVEQSVKRQIGVDSLIFSSSSRSMVSGLF